MSQVPDTLVVTGPDFEQITCGNLRITPYGRSQTTLALALIGTSPYTPSATGLIANGTDPSTATLINAVANVFETVGVGGMAKLPIFGATNVSIIIYNRGDNVLSIIPGVAGNIESYGVNNPVGIGIGESATFSCYDPPSNPGMQWWVS